MPAATVIAERVGWTRGMTVFKDRGPAGDGPGRSSGWAAPYLAGGDRAVRSVVHPGPSVRGPCTPSTRLHRDPPTRELNCHSGNLRVGSGRVRSHRTLAVMGLVILKDDSNEQNAEHFVLTPELGLGEERPQGQEVVKRSSEPLPTM